MKSRNPYGVVVALVAGSLLGWLAASGRLTSEAEAQEKASTADTVQTTGDLGAPSATTTIEGNQLPPPPPKFGGVINETAKDSKPYWCHRANQMRPVGGELRQPGWMIVESVTVGKRA